MEFILTFWGSTAKGLANLRRLKARPSTARVLARRAQDDSFIASIERRP